MLGQHFRFHTILCVFYNDVLFVCVRYIAAHLVGRRLIYPGSLLLLNIAVGVFYISRFNIEFLCVVSE